MGGVSTLIGLCLNRCGSSLFRARATSAAPSYFKAFKSRSIRGYLDGALYHNNPIRIADLERRLVWPDTQLLPPDILLSIGTSCNNSIRQEAQNNLHSPRSGSLVEDDRYGVPKGKKRITNKSKVINMMKNRVENIVDTEMTWLMFLSDAASRDEDAKMRYKRINPSIRKDPPNLDDVEFIPGLRRQIHSIVRHGDLKKQIGEIARQLVASSFYIEISKTPLNMQESKNSIFGTGFLFYGDTR